MEIQKGPVAKGTIIFFLALAIFTNAIGNVCLSYGMRAIGPSDGIDVEALYRTLERAMSNPTVLWGVGILLLFFGLFLLLLSWTDLSFVLPLLSVSYVVNTVLAHYVLHETIPISRWLGVALVCVGAYYVSTTIESGPPAPEQGESADSL